MSNAQLNVAKLRNPITNPISIIKFGAVDGATDNTTAIQNALSAGEKSILIPNGAWNFTNLTLPVGSAGAFFCLFGEGQGSRLIQKGSGIAFPTLTTLCHNTEGSIQNLSLDGTAGTGHTLDLTYGQSIDLTGLFFRNIPNGFNALKINGNPTDGSYTHDVRGRGLRIYVDSAQVGIGNAGIEYGALSSDSTMFDIVMQGLFKVNYCLKAASGALTTHFGNCHLYNPRLNCARLGGGADWVFTSNRFGFPTGLPGSGVVLSAPEIAAGGGNNVYAIGMSNMVFDDTWLQEIVAGYSGIVLDACFNNIIYNTKWDASAGGRLSIIRGINGSTRNRVVGVQGAPLSNFSDPLFLDPAGDSFATGNLTKSDYATTYVLSTAGLAPQAQNTTLYYGANGGAAGTPAAGWNAVVPGEMIKCVIAVDSTPAAGQTFTFNVCVNGTATPRGTVTITSGLFVGTVVWSGTAGSRVLNTGDQIYIQSVFSPTSGPATPRIGLLCSA